MHVAQHSPAALSHTENIFRDGKPAPNRERRECYLAFIRCMSFPMRRGRGVVGSPLNNDEVNMTLTEQQITNLESIADAIAWLDAPGADRVADAIYARVEAERLAFANGAAAILRRLRE